jgi:hypothetical protein
MMMRSSRTFLGSGKSNEFWKLVTEAKRHELSVLRQFTVAEPTPFSSFSSHIIAGHLALTDACACRRSVQEGRLVGTGSSLHCVPVTRPLS